MQGLAIFSRTYDETMDLMVEARNYLVHSERAERNRQDSLVGLRISCEAMRVTSRLTQVMAWLMMQRAVQEGEITSDQALAENNRLSAGDVCLDVSHGEDMQIPVGLRSLLSRSFRLYLRVSRIERQIIDRSELPMAQSH